MHAAMTAAEAEKYRKAAWATSSAVCHPPAPPPLSGAVSWDANDSTEVRTPPTAMPETAPCVDEQKGGVRPGVHVGAELDEDVYKDQAHSDVNRREDGCELQNTSLQEGSA